MAQLSIIIPFGTSLERPFIKERVELKAKELVSDERVEYIFVEGYSSHAYGELEALIKERGHVYLKDEAQIKERKFSQGQCRNLGARYASSSVMMFLDVDYHLSPFSLQKLLNLIKIKRIDTYINELLILPCVFLTEKGSEFLLSQNPDDWDSLVQTDLIFERKLLRFISPASSAFVMNTHKFLELGGNDKSYIGHGYEDFDLLARILKSCAEFERLPRQLNFDTRSWRFNEFKGFRAWFSLLGFEAQSYGLYLYHFWHPEPNQNGYLDNRELNHQKFYKSLKEEQNLVEPLQKHFALHQKMLVFCPENSAVYASLRNLSVYLGELICKKEFEFFDSEASESLNHERFLNFLKENEISQVIFPNPYGNELRIEIYKLCLAHKVPFIVWDRGALPDSWFFDDKGFNAESTNYSEQIWDKPLTEAQALRTKEYIKETLEGQNFLEMQGAKASTLELRRKLGIRHKKVVFVPLQVPSDTTIKHFAKAPFDYEGFLNSVNALAAELMRQDIVFVVKKHPLDLSLDKKAYEHLIFAPDLTHFLDLIELCDVVALINSGVGVYAMMMNKPCVVCGEAFYHFEGLNLRARDEGQLRAYILDVLEGRFKFDEDKALRFLHYLVFEFYSFGKSYYEKRKELKDGRERLINRTVKIDFYVIKFKGQSFLEGLSAEKMRYKLDSPVYKPYIYEITHTKFKSGTFMGVRVVPEFIAKSKFYRLTRKLLKSPRAFVMDSKSPLMKPLKALVRRRA